MPMCPVAVEGLHLVDREEVNKIGTCWKGSPGVKIGSGYFYQCKDSKSELKERENRCVKWVTVAERHLIVFSVRFSNYKGLYKYHPSGWNVITSFLHESCCSLESNFFSHI